MCVSLYEVSPHRVLLYISKVYRNPRSQGNSYIEEIGSHFIIIKMFHPSLTSADDVCATVETLVMGTFGFLGTGDELYDNDLVCIWTIISPLPLRQAYKQVYITYMYTIEDEVCSFESIWVVILIIISTVLLQL